LTAALISAGAPILFYASGERDRQIEELVKEAVEDEAIYLVGNLNQRLTLIINDLIATYAETPTSSQREHLKRTAHLIKANPFLRAINYIGADRRIIFISPMDTKNRVVGLKAETSAPQEAMERALSSSRPYLSRPFEIVQGEPGYSLMIPCADDTIFEVLFTAKDVFRKGGPLRHRNDIAMRVSDGSISVFQSLEYGNRLLALEEYMAETEAMLLNRTMLLDALPTDSLSSKASYHWRPVAGGGVVISSILLFFIVLLQAFNIRTRKKAEEELEQLRNEGQTILDSVPALIFFKNRENCFIRVNKALAEVTGLTKEEIEGKSAFDIYPDQADDYWRDDKEVMASGNPKRDIFEPVQSPDGIRWVNTYKIPYIDQRGDVIGVIGFSIDITDARTAREEIIKSKKEWERTFDVIEDSITIVDKEMRITRTNTASAKKLNCHPKDMIGKQCHEVLWGESEPCDWCPALKGHEESEMRSTNSIYSHSGRTFHVTVSPMFSNSGDFIGIVDIARDITEQERLETLLQHAQKMEAIGTMAGGIAHDFNNILAAIIGYTELAIEASERSSRVYTDLEQVLSAGNRAKELVKQILIFSRQSKAVRRPLEIGIIVKEVLRFLRSSTPTTIEIRQHIEPDRGRVMADPTQVHQVVMNLCTNAVQAIGRKGVLEVKLVCEEVDRQVAERVHGLKQGPYLKLTVTDTGCGMDHEIMEKIYDPYFTTKGIGEGTGLGLAVVHGIVKECGGAISVESARGMGSTFTVFMPEAGESGLETEAEALSPVPMGKGRILLVDDEAALVDIWTSSLEGLGYQVVGKTSGLEALRAFHSQPYLFDLVVTDLTMPNVTGMELAKEVMATRPDLPVILCTGFSESIKEKEAEEAGIRELLLKPVTRGALAQAIRRSLGG
ncbi:MAG: PAS domain-containing protein, partial [Thermodesulfobacteriota bacterium]|nr:PAS domain-containing protein [Thermodesulfobacteriota bacterium]